MKNDVTMSEDFDDEDRLNSNNLLWNTENAN